MLKLGELLPRWPEGSVNKVSWLREWQLAWLEIDFPSIFRLMPITTWPCCSITNLYALTSICIRSFWSSGSTKFCLGNLFYKLSRPELYLITCDMKFRIANYTIWKCKDEIIALVFFELYILFLLSASICRVLPLFFICIESQISIHCCLQTYIELCPVGAPGGFWDLLVNLVRS